MDLAEYNERKENFYKELDQMTLVRNDLNIDYKSYVIELTNGGFRVTREDKIINTVFEKHFHSGGD